MISSHRLELFCTVASEDECPRTIISPNIRHQFQFFFNWTMLLFIMYHSFGLHHVLSQPNSEGLPPARSSCASGSTGAGAAHAVPARQASTSPSPRRPPSPRPAASPGGRRAAGSLPAGTPKHSVAGRGVHIESRGLLFLWLVRDQVRAATESTRARAETQTHAHAGPTAQISCSVTPQSPQDA